MNKGFKFGAGALALVLSATAVNAAGTSTGIEAGFTALGDDLDLIIGGAGGFVVLIMSVVIAAITLVFTGRWGSVGVAFGVAILLGYGLTTLSSFAGLTASVLSVEVQPAASAVPVAPVAYVVE